MENLCQSSFAGMLKVGRKENASNFCLFLLVTCIGVLFLGSTMFTLSNGMILLCVIARHAKRHQGQAIPAAQLPDNTDTQWRGFRSNLPLMTAMMAGLLMADRLLAKCALRWSTAKRKLLVSMVFLFAMHGIHCITIFIFVAFFYQLVRLLRNSKQLKKPLVWALTLVYLKIFDVAKSVPGGLWYFGFKRLIRRYSLFEGFYPNWEVLFNLTILKMISFAMDYYEFLEKQPFAVPMTVSEYPDKRERQNCSYASLQDFSFINFCSYIFYFPLFIAGPIVTFFDWNFQCKLKNPNLQRGKAIKSFVIPFVVIELFNHLFYVRCMKEFGSFANFSFWQTVAYSYWSLKFLWLKFLVLWRYFRAISIIDGIEPPENMLRCMSNHLSTMGFWRSWHASFNSWMIKYVYLPLGGSRLLWCNIWIVFGFAAAWHNFNFTMFCWGTLIPLFMLPELLCGLIVKRYELSKLSFYWMLRATGGSINVVLMVVANMIGYALDEKTVYILLKNLWKHKTQLAFNVGILFSILFSTCYLMMEKRAHEKRDGIHNKY